VTLITIVRNFLVKNKCGLGISAFAALDLPWLTSLDGAVSTSDAEFCAVEFGSVDGSGELCRERASLSSAQKGETPG
jgi:hypothetical protein